MTTQPRDPDTKSPDLFSANESAERGPRVYLSGAWEIDCAQRELRARGTPVPIGSRAFDIIEVLVQSMGELVTKHELMARVWPSGIVEDNTLQVHISAIRKALGADRSLLKTISGRGYWLMGNWSIRTPRADPEALSRPRTRDLPFQTNVPVATSALIGRETAVQELQNLLSAYRVVTLTGPGGIGKTVLASEVARRLFPAVESDVMFVGLVSLSNQSLVASAVASTFGFQLGGAEISPEAVAKAVGSKRVLTVLDNCEHVIDAAARMAETLLRLCPRTTILATSREVLRIDGEYVYQVPPLAVPTEHREDSADVLGHSAVQLFVARTKSLRADFAPGTENLPSIATICRRLDGIPLALEFAAARAATLGVSEIAGRLDDRFALLAGGRRTALPRHQTLRATLDWSYDLLPEPERRLLRHLAIFTAGFTLEAAAAVMSGGVSAIATGIANLISKSLVTIDASASGRWRLLETIRAYALEKLADGGEREHAARRHAEFFRKLFAARPQSQLATDDMLRGIQEIDNIRAALDWCFSPAGDSAIGIGLASAAAPAFLAMSLLTEGHHWSARALLALDDTNRGGEEEMHLQAALGVSLMFTRGGVHAARVALSRSLAIAEERGGALVQLRVLSLLQMFHLRTGDFKVALHYGKQCSVVAGAVEDAAALGLAHTMLGFALHLSGDLGNARAELEAVLRQGPRTQRTTTMYLGFEHENLAGSLLARTLWLQGQPAQAMELTRRIVDDAASTNQSLTLAIALSWAISVFLWIGDLRSAEEHIDWFISNANSHSFAPYLAVGRGRKGELAIRRGDAKGGVESLRRCLHELHATPYELLTTELNTALIQGLAAIGAFGEGIALIEETIRLVEANGDFMYMPELLRVKGRLLLSASQRSADEAETCFTKSLELAQRQGARAWELRGAIDLASLWAAREQPERARVLLTPVFERFEVGLETVDLKAAERLLSALNQPSHSRDAPFPLS
jgi:predicted ATPase/DNA-binding winged helix-turn-helix (wHTH) protein